MSTRDIIQRLNAAGDRLREAHFFLHGMEDSYHFADPFRWHLNAFLRPPREIPQLVTVAVQIDASLLSWHRGRRQQLRHDPLIDFRSEQRDFVAHQGMIVPNSAACIGLTEGRGMKLGMGHRVDPYVDSDVAMLRFAKTAVAGHDFLGILAIDDEDSLPAIERKWILEQFPDSVLVELCAEAWVRVAAYLGDVVLELGQSLDPPDLFCRHGAGAFRIRAYGRAELRKGKIELIRLPGGSAL